MCDFAPNREAAMVTIATDEDGTPTVWCDPCIADLVQMLNENGYPTVASCCGHGRRPSIISLLDGRAVMVLDEREQEQMIDVWPGINGEPTKLEADDE